MTRGRSASKNPESWKCCSCGKNYQDDHDSILCERCNSWVCIECTEMDQAEFNALGKSKKLHFYCDKCEPKAKEAVKLDQKVEDCVLKHTKKFEKKMEALEKEVKTKASSKDLQEMSDRLEQRVVQVENKVTVLETQEPEPNTNQELLDKVKDEVKESLDQEKRRLNVIIRNINEDNADIHTFVDEIFTNVMNLNNISIQNIERIGEKKEDYVRPVKVTVKTFSMKKMILAGSKKLATNENFKDIYIAPDRTKKQQLQMKKLRDELKDRRENGEKDLIIKNGVIIKAPTPKNE